MKLPNLPSLPTVSNLELWMIRSMTVCMASFISLIAMAGMSTIVEPQLGWGTVATLLFAVMILSSGVGLYLIVEEDRRKKSGVGA